MLLTIARKELKMMFVSPLAWVLLSLMLVVSTWVFLGRMDAYLHIQPQLLHIANPPGFTEIIVIPVFSLASLILLMITPLLTMRQIAEERKNHTLTLLISSPVSMSEIVLGKFLALIVFLTGIIALLVLLSGTLLLGGDMDIGLLLSCAAGLLLVSCCYISLGLYLSSLTMQPVIAALGTLGILSCFWVFELVSTAQTGWLHYFSILKHFEQFNHGLLDSFSIVYLVLFTLFFLIMTIRHLDGERLYR